MLALETTDNWGWTVTVTVPSYSPATFTNAQPSAKALPIFVAWLNGAGRPWHGHAVFDWSWARNTYAPDSTKGGAKLRLTCSTAFTLATSDSLFCNSTGMNPDTGVTSLDGVVSAKGTWCPLSKVSVKSYARLLDKGDCGGGNLIRPGVPGLAHYNPTVEAMGTANDAARLADILANASNPRRCWVYQVHTDTWLDLALGAVDRSPVDYTFYKFTVHTAGESL